MIYSNLKKYFFEVKNHTDLTYKSIPFFNQIIRAIKVELLKISSQQGEQISQDVTDAMRLIGISEREDLSGIQNYPKEIPKYLTRVKTTILSSLAFASK
jgi:hypothetical protein